jgi:hypothetical protein
LLKQDREANSIEARKTSRPHDSAVAQPDWQRILGFAFDLSALRLDGRIEAARGTPKMPLFTGCPLAFRLSIPTVHSQIILSRFALILRRESHIRE